MAKGKSNPNWKEKVLECEASGKTIRTWCQENKIPVTTLFGWKNRLKKSNSVKAKAGFIELKEQTRSDPGVVLEYNGIKIHLQLKFDKILLKQCLDCLREVSC